jgi:hypothetical protein
MTAFSAPQERMQNYGTKPSEPLFSTKVTLSQVARPRFGHRQRGSRILPAESRLAGRLRCAAGRETDLSQGRGASGAIPNNMPITKGWFTNNASLAPNPQ